MPGVSLGTSSIDCWRWLSGWSGDDLPITISSLQSLFIAPEVNHLRPLTTQWSPSCVIEQRMLVASLEATAGSVIEKAERMVPASSGFSHRSCWAGVP